MASVQTSGRKERRTPTSEEVLEAFDRAGRDAIIRHKKLGCPVIIWRDGQIVEVPPEEIPDDGVFRTENSDSKA